MAASEGNSVAIRAYGLDRCSDLWSLQILMSMTLINIPQDIVPLLAICKELTRSVVDTLQMASRKTIYSNFIVH